VGLNPGAKRKNWGIRGHEMKTTGWNDTAKVGEGDVCGREAWQPVRNGFQINPPERKRTEPLSK